MTKRALFDQLARSNHRIARGKEHIAQQRDIIAALEIWGLDAGRSVELLNTFLETQRLHEKERERLLRELLQIPASPIPKNDIGFILAPVLSEAIEISSFQKGNI